MREGIWVYHRRDIMKVHPLFLRRGRADIGIGAVIDLLELIDELNKVIGTKTDIIIYADKKSKFRGD